MHVRSKKTPLTNFIFKLGENVVDFCANYKYLGVLISEHLNFEHMAEARCGGASRALGSIITKMKKFGNFPQELYIKLDGQM